MSTPRLASDAATLLGARVVGMGLNLATLAVVARSLDAESFGRWAAVIAVVGFALVGTTFGTDTLITRTTARDTRQGLAVARGALLLQLAGSAALLAACAGAVAAGLVATPWILGAAILVPSALVSVDTALMRGAERPDLHAIVTVAAAAGALAGALVVAATGASVDRHLAAAFAAASAAASLSRVLRARVARERSRGGDSSGDSSVSLGAVARSTAPFAVMVATTAAATQLPIVITSWIGGAAAAGAVALATRVVESLRLAPAAIVNAAFPSMARRPERAPDPLQRLGPVVTAIAVVAAVAVVVLADPICARVFDQPGAATALRVLVLALPLMVLRLFGSFALLAADRERRALGAAVVGLVTTVGGVAVVADRGPGWVAGAVVAGVAVHLAALGRTRELTAATDA